MVRGPLREGRRDKGWITSQLGGGMRIWRLSKMGMLGIVLRE